MSLGPNLGDSLWVWAHPDDEVLTSAGLMAINRKLGNRVVCLTATRGEEGVQDESRWPRERLGEIRQKEMEEGLQVIGVEEHHWLDYHDGSCDQVDPEEAIAKVVHWMQQVSPSAVFTFGPDGMTGHPDHLAVSLWTTEAFTRAAPKGARLYYVAMSQEWSDRFIPMFAPFNIFPDGPPKGLLRKADMEIHVALPDQIMDLKVEAVSKHQSQMEPLMAVLGPEEFREAHRDETFRLAMIR